MPPSCKDGRRFASLLCTRRQMSWLLAVILWTTTTTTLLSPVVRADASSSSVYVEQSATATATCSVSSADGALWERDPALHLMPYNVGDGPQETWVYVEPDIASFYQGNPPAPRKVQPKFKGFAAKFINLSNQRVTLYWEDKEGGTKHVMRDHKPFTASGTASFPGHRFYFCEHNQPDRVLQFMMVGDYPANIYVYDPFRNPNDPVATEQNLKVLNREDRKKYDQWRRTLSFHEQYLNFTGRSYLANYLRKPPMHYMWRADYFGQEHWVATRETHFRSLPSDKNLLAEITVHGSKRVLKDSSPRLLQEYREPGILNMTLKVLSCAPRVFEIRNFLSPVEVQHILELAGHYNLSLSSTGDITADDERIQEDSRRTRTSTNSWVARERSPVVDAIYRRAADLQRVDEALMRFRLDKKEWTNLTSVKPLTEQLQLVHYDFKQEYTAHHDFGFARVDDKLQGARFSTLLLYLNDGMKGGETSFPRWVNAETFQQLKVRPEAGKAVLFYSQLPDGNFDDFSHHAALPVYEGEKWLINLWFWDPIYD